ncbi:gamma-glutamylcyclotransferase family protein [Clostridium algifaecis]
MLYFSYGSNLNLEQMAKRCPDCVPVVKVKLKGYKLVFNRVADIVEADAEVVYGAVYEVSPRDVKKLDIYEGYPRLYTKIFVRVKDDNGKVYEAFVYVMVNRVSSETSFQQS